MSRFVYIIETRAVQKIHSFCNHSYLYFYLVVILTYNRIIFHEILFKRFFIIFHGIILVCILCMLLFLKGMRGKKYALICVLFRRWVYIIIGSRFMSLEVLRFSTPQYNWNIVESDVKHYKPINPPTLKLEWDPMIIILVEYRNVHLTLFLFDLQRLITPSYL